MALDPKPNQPGIPKVASAQEHLEQIFSYKMFPEAPSFYEYLEGMRGLDRKLFDTTVWQVLALNSEMLFYTNMLRELSQAKMHEQKAKASEQATKSAMAAASVEDLMASRNYMAQQLDRIDAELAKAAQERADATA